MFRRDENGGEIGAEAFIREGALLQKIDFVEDWVLNEGKLKDIG